MQAACIGGDQTRIAPHEAPNMAQPRDRPRDDAPSSVPPPRSPLLMGRALVVSSRGEARLEAPARPRPGLLPTADPRQRPEPAPLSPGRVASGHRWPPLVGGHAAPGGTTRLPAPCLRVMELGHEGPPACAEPPPVCAQWLSRRPQGLGLPSRVGSARPGEPVQSIQRRPSTPRRSSPRGAHPDRTPAVPEEGRGALPMGLSGVLARPGLARHVSW
jgi:hypothetical protein